MTIIENTVSQADQLASGASATGTHKEPAASFDSVLAETKRKREAAPESASTDQTRQSGASTDSLPIEAFSLPDWYGAYLPKQTSVNQTIDHDYFALAESLSSDGDLNTRDRATLRNYLDNNPEHQQQLENARFRQQYRHEIAEYDDILRGYFSDALESRDIQGPHQYYESIVLDKGISEEVHQEVHDKLMNDPRAIELMAVLGIES